jgi:hypothetical protein
VFKLHCPDGLPELRENYGFSKKELSHIAHELTDKLKTLCLEWRKIHEDY